MEKILILGGGQSAFYAIDTFRKENTKDVIELISDEQFLPYERPPLSKGLLLNNVEEKRIYFRNKNSPFTKNKFPFRKIFRYKFLI